MCFLIRTQAWIRDSFFQDENQEDTLSCKTETKTLKTKSRGLDTKTHGIENFKYRPTTTYIHVVVCNFYFLYPETGSPTAVNVVVVLVFLEFLLSSDFQSTKTFYRATLCVARSL